MLLLLAMFIFNPAKSAPLGPQEGWSRVSDPLIMDRNFETRLYALPNQGEVNMQRKYWSSDYWPLNKGNINRRWHASADFSMPSPTLAQAKVMTVQQLAQLSPAEKFDLLNSRYYYPLKQEVIRISNPNAQYWEGICHGWAPAAMNHSEPIPKTIRNREGIAIPFGSADIKGILSYFYAYIHQVHNTHQVGRRCEDDNCAPDLNPGAFHIVLTNKVGLDKTGFIADIAANTEVWNHPIVSYVSTIIGESRGPTNNSAPGTTRIVHMNTKINYVDEADNSWNPVPQKLLSLKISYLLEIDAYGQIIGGEWRSMKKPDFLWTMQKPSRFIGNYMRLTELLID